MISDNNLSEGLPDNIFTDLLSLTDLFLDECGLVTLPSRCVLYIVMCIILLNIVHTRYLQILAFFTV